MSIEFSHGEYEKAWEEYFSKKDKIPKKTRDVIWYVIKLEIQRIETRQELEMQRWKRFLDKLK